MAVRALAMSTATGDVGRAPPERAWLGALERPDQALDGFQLEQVANGAAGQLEQAVAVVLGGDAHERAREARGRALGAGTGAEGLDRRAQRRYRGSQLFPLGAGQRPADVDQRTPVAEREGERSGRIGQVRVEVERVHDGVVSVLRLQAQLLAVLGVERQLGVLREGAAQGLQEGVVELAGRATAAEGAGDDLTEPARIRFRRTTDCRGHVQNGTIRLGNRFARRSDGP